MIDLHVVPDEQLSQTLRLMKQEFITRGWSSQIPYVGSAHCFIHRDDGKKLHVYSATPPIASYAAAHLANDKYGTYQNLLGKGLPQLETRLLYNDSDLNESIKFMQRVKNIVVKPVDGGHGKGITTNVSDEEQLRRAIITARSEEKSITAVLLQEQYQHETILDIRILCIDYKFVAAIWRVPARVYGDGHSTVAELIEKENRSERRGKPYFSVYARIDVEKTHVFLGEHIDDVPLLDEEVAVLGIANYGAGGETIDISDELPDWLKKIGEKTAQACELSVIGVDVLLATKPSVDSNPEELDPMIIEVNKCPSLSIHDVPTSGTPRPATTTYIDYLASL